MSEIIEIARIKMQSPLTNAIQGQVKWSPAKSLWVFGHLAIAIIGGVLTFAWDAVLVFLFTTTFTLCFGHSLGMHRKLIHQSYQCPKWLEYFFVHLGTIVGLAGPFGMVHTHDLSDWAQRQKHCHSYLRHGENIIKDGWWQLHCDLKLEHPPVFTPEEALKNDAVYRFMEKTWMLQQLPLLLILFAFGGVAWVIWGISARIVVSVAGHWLIGYFAHNHGEMDHEVVDAAVQGHNVKWASYITMGESWHNNHHAFPDSAILGIYDNQPDPGWWALNAMKNIGLVWDIVLPEDLPHRNNLKALTYRAVEGTGNKSPFRCPVTGLYR